MSIVHQLFSNTPNPERFIQYVTTTYINEENSYFTASNETFAMSAWRHSVGRVSAVASLVIVALGATLQLCKLGVMAAVCGITGGLYGHVVKALQWNVIESEFAMLPKNLKAVTSWYFESFLTPKPGYPAFWASPYVSYIVLTGTSLYI